jgi:hypothetical protein
MSKRSGKTSTAALGGWDERPDRFAQEVLVPPRCKLKVSTRWPSDVMISKCANPACSVRFLYLHHGKLFRFEREAQGDKGPLLGFDPNIQKHSRGVEFFWLCDECSARMTLVYRKGIGVTTRPSDAGLKAAS